MEHIQMIFMKKKNIHLKRAKDGSAVLNYSLSFNSTNDSYDLLFGLGLLDFKNATNKTLTFSDADINTVYGITDLKATGTNVASDDAKGDLFISWSCLMYLTKWQVPINIR